MFFFGFFFGINVLFWISTFIQFLVGSCMGLKVFRFKVFTSDYQRRGKRLRRFKQKFMLFPAIAMSKKNMTRKDDVNYMTVATILTCVLALVLAIPTFKNFPDVYQNFWCAFGAGVLLMALLQIFALVYVVFFGKKISKGMKYKEMLSSGVGYESLPISAEDIRSCIGPEKDVDRYARQYFLVMAHRKFFMLGDINAMKEIIAVAEHNLPAVVNKDYFSSYSLLLFHYSFCEPIPQKAIPLFNQVAQMLYEDDDVNSLAPLSSYKLFIEGNLKEALELANRADMYLEEEKQGDTYIDAEIKFWTYVINTLKKTINERLTKGNTD